MDIGTILFVVGPFAVAGLTGFALESLWPAPVADAKSDDRPAKRKADKTVDETRSAVTRAKARQDEQTPLRAVEPTLGEPVESEEPEEAIRVPSEAFDMPADFDLAEYSGRPAQ